MDKQNRRTYDELRETPMVNMTKEERMWYGPKEIDACSIWENKALMYLAWHEAYLLDDAKTFEEYCALSEAKQTILDIAMKWICYATYKHFLHEGVVRNSNMLNKFKTGEAYYTTGKGRDYKGCEYFMVVGRTDDTILWERYGKVYHSNIQVEEGHEVCYIGNLKMDCRCMATHDENFYSPLGYIV